MKLFRIIPTTRIVNAHPLLIGAALAIGCLLAVVGYKALAPVEPLAFKVDDIAVTNTSTVGTSENIGVSTGTASLNSRAANPLTLEDTGSPSNLLKINSSGGTWDFDPVPATGSTAQTIRFFRHTVTSAALSIQLTIGNSSTANMTLNAIGQSAMRYGLLANAADLTILTGLSATNNLTAQTQDAYKLLNASGTGTYNTTAGNLSAYGLFSSITGGRSSGANTLTKYAVYGNSSGAQVDYSGYFDNGLFQVNGVATFSGTSTAFAGAAEHLRATGTTIIPTSCGTSPTVAGNNIAGKITIGATGTGCVVPFTTYTNAPACNVSYEGAGTGTFTLSATALTITAVAATTFDYICIGLI